MNIFTDLEMNNGYFISKYPKDLPEIRILYTFDFEKGKLINLKIFDFVIGQFIHEKSDPKNYVNQFREFYKANIKSKEFTPFLQVFTNEY